MNVLQADLAANVHSIRSKELSEHAQYDDRKYDGEATQCLQLFEKWEDAQQVDFVTQLLKKMCHYQHGQINGFLKPMLQRDFISALPGNILPRVREL